MDVSKYLARIGFVGEPQVDLETLTKLQVLHQTHVPWENLDVIMRIPIVLELQSLYDKIVIKRRGGWCAELNALFCWLLQQLGFHVDMINVMALNFVTRNTWNRDFDHMGLVVHIDGAKYFADVGWGENKAALHPLLLEPNIKVEQPNGRFWLKVTQPDDFWLLCWQFLDEPDSENWHVMCRFKFDAHRLEDFQETNNIYFRGEEELMRNLCDELVVFQKTWDEGAKEVGSDVVLNRKYRRATRLGTKQGAAFLERKDDLTLDMLRAILAERFRFEAVESICFDIDKFP